MGTLPCSARRGQGIEEYSLPCRIGALGWIHQKIASEVWNA
jgi:hypothetical protein